MASPPVCDFGWPAPDFNLPATDGAQHSRDALMGPNGLLVMFICNHCPYVLAILDPLVREAHTLMDMGVGVAAICSNDATTHPADGFGPMTEMAAARGFRFPYLHDEDQSVARAYDAACTPDFFGFNREGALQYRGRFDATRTGVPARDAPRDLLDAMRQIAATGIGPEEQVPSIGCSIKWKAT